MKNAAWDKKAAEMGMEADKIKGWWRGIHAIYGRLHKKTSGQARPKFTERQQWILDHAGWYAVQIRHNITGQGFGSVSIF